MKAKPKGGLDTTQVFPLQTAARWQSPDSAREVMEALGLGHCRRAQGAPARWAPPVSTPASPQGHSKPRPAVTDVCHPGRQGRCPWCPGDSFSSASPTPFGLPKSLFSWTPATPMSPSLPVCGQSFVNFTMHLFKTLLNPWPERHLVVMGPTG